MLGDPMVDIATMRMRNSYEPLGDMRVLCRDYEAFADAPIDYAAVDFHTLMFSTLGAMQFTGTVGASNPGDPHATYLEFDLALRQVILEALGGLMGLSREPEPAATERVGDNAGLIAKLSDILGRIQTASPLDESHKDAASQIIEWLARSDALGAEMRGRDLRGHFRPAGKAVRRTGTAAQATLEALVQTAGPDPGRAAVSAVCGHGGPPHAGMPWSDADRPPVSARRPDPNSARPRLAPTARASQTTGKPPAAGAGMTQASYLNAEEIFDTAAREYGLEPYADAGMRERFGSSWSACSTRWARSRMTPCRQRSRT